MSDPRAQALQARSANHTPLRKAINDSRKSGTPVNWCMFGCGPGDLDEAGACAHLVGYTNGGRSYEPRVRRPDRKVVTDGSKKQPLKRGMVLARDTTTSRVYSPKPNPDLVVARTEEDIESVLLADEEAKALALAEELKGPLADGPWRGTSYDSADADDAEDYPDAAHVDVDASELPVVGRAAMTP